MYFFFCSQEGIDFLVEDNCQAEENAQVSKEGKRRQLLQVSYPAEHHHRDNEDGHPSMLSEGDLKRLAENLNGGEW